MRLKKKREIPFVRQLLLCWHATALQLRQQPGNPHRAYYWWLAVNQWSLTTEIENPSRLFCTLPWWSGIPSVAQSRCLSAAVSPLYLSNALQMRQVLFCMGRGFSDYCEQWFLWAGFLKCLFWTTSIWIKNSLVSLNPQNRHKMEKDFKWSTSLMRKGWEGWDCSV